MSALPISTPFSGNPVLDAIDGGQRWSGDIVFNRVDAQNPVEVASFVADLPSKYVTANTGLPDAIWNLVPGLLTVMQGYAAFSFSISDTLSPNYFVSDFSNPSNPNNAGIAAGPGNTPILALSPTTWGSYTPQIQQWVVLHELGHTLGLRHVTDMPGALDFSQYTVMSYNWYQLADEAYGDGLPLTPMALDVAVLQAKYGAAAANLGATTYTLSNTILDRDGADGSVQNGRGYICIWDSSGQDALAYGGSSAVLLNLNAATLKTSALSGGLADVIGDVAATSRIFSGLTDAAKAELTDPLRNAGGFFSSMLDGNARAPAGYTIANGAKVENASGGSGSDLIVGNELSNVLTGNGGADDLFGGDGEDSLDGGVGDDRLFGGNGADTVTDLSGGSNYLRGDEGDDRLTGGAGFDDINGNMGDDTADGGAGDDWVVGGKDDDDLTGGEGADLVYGNLGRDTLAGDAGDDIVRGGQQDDVLFGGDGADYISGDRDNDTVSGGAGADIFHTFGDAGLDRVLDFSLADGDRVQLDPGTVFTVSQSGADTLISMTGGGQMVLVGVQMSGLAAGWIFGA